MALFGRREVVFKTVGSKERWKVARASVYYVSVRPEDVDRARVVLLDAVGAPLESDELILPPKKTCKIPSMVIIWLQTCLDVPDLQYVKAGDVLERCDLKFEIA